MRNVAALLDEEVDEDCELEDKKERGSIEFLNCEGDGIFDNIYEVMWTQQDVKSRINVVVPDTVVFKFNKPTSWYYSQISTKGTSSDPAVRLHKKKPSALRVGLILKHFEKSCVNCCSDIVAYYISQTEATGHGHRESRIQYLTRDELPHFLLHTRNKNGILQGFVDPKPSTSQTYNNCLIRCTWSQSVCLVERRTNVHLLTSQKISRYDRAETFEGDFRNSNEYPLTSAKLLEQIQVVCSNIVTHFSYVATGKVGISNMVVNFKFDTATRLHFLWCESIRLLVKKQPLTGQLLAPKPTQIGGMNKEFIANKLNLPPKSQQGQEYRRCKFCGTDCAISDVVTSTYRTLLCTYDEIKLTSKVHSVPIQRLKDRWKGVTRSNRHAAKRQTDAHFEKDTVPVDTHSFTQPMNTDGKELLAHIDERILLSTPNTALRKAIKEWDERQIRNDNANSEKEPQQEIDDTDGPPRSCSDVPGIPWFIKKLHPYITLKDWLHVRNREDFLSLEVVTCAFCFLGLSHGLFSADTLRMYHKKLANKPKLQCERILAPLHRNRVVENDDRRIPSLGRSRLLVPCRIRFRDPEVGNDAQSEMICLSSKKESLQISIDMADEQSSPGGSRHSTPRLKSPKLDVTSRKRVVAIIGSPTSTASPSGGSVKKTIIPCDDDLEIEFMKQRAETAMKWARRHTGSNNSLRRSRDVPRSSVTGMSDSSRTPRGSIISLQNSQSRISIASSSSGSSEQSVNPSVNGIQLQPVCANVSSKLKLNERLRNLSDSSRYYSRSKLLHLSARSRRKTNFHKAVDDLSQLSKPEQQTTSTAVTAIGSAATLGGSQ